MSHGTPDWGLVGPKTTTYGLDDLGEHAVRLGSPHSFDRRGDVIAADTFDQGMGEWSSNWNGTLAAVSLWMGENRQGPFCVALTAGSSANGWAGIGRSVPYTVRSRVGLEASIGLDPNTFYWEWALTWRDDVRLWDARMRYDFQNQNLDYWDNAGRWQPFATGVRVGSWSGVWHTGKLVIDLTTSMYVRALFAENEYDLSMHAIQRGLPTNRVELQASLRHYGVLTFNPVGKVDSVIMTRNEP